MPRYFHANNGRKVVLELKVLEGTKFRDRSFYSQAAKTIEVVMRFQVRN